MTAIKASDIDRFIARPNPAQPIVLLYGPDAGLVRERVDALVRASVDDPNDPFTFVRIEGEELSGNPARLVEEANTIPLFGGRRAVLVRANPRYNLAPALTTLIEAPPPDCRVIIEAGELRKTSPLRALCEKAKTAAALPCYLDNAQAISSLIDEEMRAAKLTLASEARAALAALLGGDRLASRSELRKLAFYVMGRERVELDDVLAVVADASEQALDGVIDAAFAGKTAEVETEYNKARSSVGSAAAIVSAAIRQVANLHKMKLAVEGGDTIEFAMMRGTPPVHFTRKNAVETALRAWSPPRLLRAMQQLAEASLDIRRNSALAEPIAQRTLLMLSQNARRREN